MSLRNGAGESGGEERFKAFRRGPAAVFDQIQREDPYEGRAKVGAETSFGKLPRTNILHGMGLIPSYRKLLWSKAMVVSVAEKSGR